MQQFQYYCSAIGNWQVEGSSAAAEAVDGYAACTLGEMPPAALLEARISAQSQTRGCGLLLRCADDLESYYQIRWEPRRQRIVVDRWPRPGDQPYMLERAIPGVRNEQLRLKAFIQDTVLVVYINESVALNCRLYDHLSGQLGLFVSEGGAAFEQLTMRALSPQ